MSVDDRLTELEPLARVIRSLQTDLAAVTEDRDRWKAIANRYTSGLDLVVGCEVCVACAHVVAQVLNLPQTLQRPPEGSMTDSLEPDRDAFREVLIKRIEQWFPNDDAPYNKLDELLDDAAGYELGLTQIQFDDVLERLLSTEEKRDELQERVAVLEQILWVQATGLLMLNTDQVEILTEVLERLDAVGDDDG